MLEATPDYLYQNTALDVIGALPTLPKVLFVLRKPSERVYSLFQFARNNVSVIDKKVSFRSFLEAVMGGDRHGIIRNRPILQNAIRHSQYVNYLEPWIVRMGGQVSVELFEDMRTDPKLFMMRLADHLGIDNAFFEDFDFSPKNKTYAVKNQAMHLIKKKLSSFLPSGAYRQVLRSMYAKANTERSSKKTAEDMEALKMLDAHFAEFNDRLELLTGLDLSSWRG